MGSSSAGVALLMVIGGISLAYSGLKGIDPRSLFTSVFTGSAPTPLPPLPSSGASPLSSDTAATTGGSNPPITGGTTPGSGGVTPAVLAFQSEIQKHFPQATNAGICACRYIIPHDGGTSTTWSEHAWCNAIDFGGSTAVMAGIMAYAYANKIRLHIDNIIGPGSAVNVVHVDFYPNHAGQTPPCASSGGN